MTSYTTATWTDSGLTHWSPELASNTARDLVQTVGVADMPALATSLENYHYRVVLKDGDAIVANAGGGVLVSCVLTFGLQKLFSQFCARLNPSGQLRFIHRNSAQLQDLSSAIQSVGCPAPAGLTDAYGSLAEGQAVNNAFKTANIPISIWKA